MRGLTVRWSLDGAPDDVAEQLAAYVEESSHARFTDLPGLRFKTWRIKPGQWFEGCYVFATDEERSDFQRQFSQGAAESPGSQIVGSAPILVEECEIVAIAEGREGFQSAARY
ncbi:MAG: hypothetical protein ACRDO4_11290 [Nocardioides sp.]